MQTSNDGKDLIRSFEGLRLKAYWDVDGWAVGYGDHEGAHEGLVITRDEAERRLDRRVKQIESAVQLLLGRKPTQPQLDAMVSLAYNIGMGWYGVKKKPGERDGFRQSTVLRQFNAGNDVAAANAFTLWTKVTVNGKKVDDPALVRRRSIEKALFLKNVALTAAQQEAPIMDPVSPRPEAPAPLATTGTIQGAKVAAWVTALGIIKSLVDQFQDALMNIPWLGELFQLMVAYSPKIALALGLGALLAIGYVVVRRATDRAEGRV